MTIRTNLKAGGLSRNHNETLRARTKLRSSINARRLTRGALALAAGLVTTVFLAAPAHAQSTVVTYTCDLNGTPGRLTLQVEAVTNGGVFIDSSGFFRGSLITGVTYFLSGTVTSTAGRYSFNGQNQFVDFVDLLTNDRFRVKVITQGQYLLMIINPEGPGPTQHLCQLSVGYR